MTNLNIPGGWGGIMTDDVDEAERILKVLLGKDTDPLDDNNPDPDNYLEDHTYQVVDVTLHNGIVKSFFYDVTIEDRDDGYLLIESLDKKMLIDKGEVKYIEMDRTGISPEDKWDESLTYEESFKYEPIPFSP